MRAVGLFSGGLDSILAARVLIDLGVEVHAINFVSPFFGCTPDSNGCSSVDGTIEQLGGIPLKRVALGDEYLEMIKSPRFGHGRGMNPCIDCRIMIIRKAAVFMREIGASFVFTGEVLGQRPMSQHRKAMEIIDRESGIQGYLLRPLSAAFLKPTIPEQQGLIDRSKLPAIQGRSRKIQISMAREKGIEDFPTPNGGCLLTDINFAERISDYLTRVKKPSMADIPLLKVGRFRKLDSGKFLLISRNESEGDKMQKLFKENLNMFMPENFAGPVIISDSVFTPEVAGYFKRYGKINSGSENRIECRENGTTVTKYL